MYDNKLACVSYFEPCVSRCCFCQPGIRTGGAVLPVPYCLLQQVKALQALLSSFLCVPSTFLFHARLEYIKL